MGLESTLDRQKDQHDGMEKGKIGTDGAFLMEDIGMHRAACNALLHNTLLSARTKTEYRIMLDSLEKEKNAADMMKENVSFLEATLSGAERYKGIFSAGISLAQSQGWISAESAAGWWSRFDDPSLLEWTRKEWVLNKFPVYLKNWKDHAERRKELARTVPTDLTDADVPGLSILRNNDAFQKLHYDDQENLLNKMQALKLAEVTGKKALFKETQETLTRASTGEQRYIHPAKTGVFLKTMMEAKNPDQFRNTILFPSLTTLRHTRQSYDTFRADCTSAKSGVKPAALHVYLQWDAEKRDAYLAEGQRRLASEQQQETADQECAALKTLIERTMDMEDWEGAEILLADAVALYPKDRDWPIMQRYLEQYRTDLQEEKEQKTIDQAKQDIHDLLAEVSPASLTTYITALEGGPDQFAILLDSMYQGALEGAAKEEEDTPAPKHARQPEDLRDEEEDDNEDAEKDEGEQDVIEVEDTADEQREALQNLTQQNRIGRKKHFAFSHLSAAQHLSNHHQVNLPMMRHLRYLHSKGETYSMAA